MRESSSSDLDRGRNDPSQRTAIADFARNDLLPSVVHGAAAKGSWVTDCVDTANAFSGAEGVVAAQSALVEIAKDAGVG